MILTFIKKIIEKYINKNNVEKTLFVLENNNYFEEVIKNIPNVKRPKILALDRYHLLELIKLETQVNGIECDLNHIDVSNITDMSHLFVWGEFNGDISQWNVSNVENMSHMFHKSYFNGDISNWDVSKVEDMNGMFYFSKFNGDISRWDVSNVKNMDNMFYGSSFSQDLLIWRPYSLEHNMNIFTESNASVPYWAELADNYDRKIFIDNYWIKKELEKELNKNEVKEKRIKV